MVISALFSLSVMKEIFFFAWDSKIAKEMLNKTLSSLTYNICK